MIAKVVIIDNYNFKIIVAVGGEKAIHTISQQIELATADRARIPRCRNDDADHRMRPGRGIADAPPANIGGGYLARRAGSQKMLAERFLLSGYRVGFVRHIGSRR